MDTQKVTRWLMMNDLSLKVVVIGDSCVGKTCISLRYLTGEFSGQTRPTIAAGFCNAKVKLGKTDIDLLIWDTAGQEAYRGLTSQYYRDAKLALIVFDLSKPATLTTVNEWHSRLLDANQTPIVVVLVGNKADLPTRQVSRDQGEAVATEIGAIYRETSALTGKGVSEVFEDACEQYLKNNPTAAAMKRPPSVELKDGSKPKGGCC
jgi:small GTP-binding protein